MAGTYARKRVGFRSSGGGDLRAPHTNGSMPRTITGRFSSSDGLQGARYREFARAALDHWIKA